MRRFATAGVLALSMAAAPQAFAGDWYYSAGVGQMMIDAPGVDDPTNVSFTVGYELGLVAADLGLEGTLSTTLDEGSTPGGADVEADTAAAYVAFRSAGPLYLIAKGGVAYQDVTIGGSSDDDTDTSYGAGLGFSLALIQFELEYTRVGEDVDYISLSARF